VLIGVFDRMKEASKGYYHDYNRARRTGGGKLWMAPNVLIREDVRSFFVGDRGS
jgi:ATPase complex subunit ATP10